MNNNEVARAWVRGQSGKADNFKTDGTNLWSYGLLIGTVEDGKRIVYNYTSGGSLGFVSMTTSKHVGIARRALAFR